MNIQIQCMGIHLDHKQENRRAWLFYAIAYLAVIFVEAINSWLSFTSLEILSAYASDLYGMIISMTIQTSFTILLCNIQKRYALLNFMLRFAVYSIIKHPNIFLINSTFGFWHRRHFLRGRKLNGSSIEHKERSIKCIKFIGRQHLLLTDTVHQLNHCYSFKVRLLTLWKWVFWLFQGRLE